MPPLLPVEQLHPGQAAPYGNAVRQRRIWRKARTDCPYRPPWPRNGQYTCSPNTVKPPNTLSASGLPKGKRATRLLKGAAVQCLHDDPSEGAVGRFDRPPPKKPSEQGARLSRWLAAGPSVPRPITSRATRRPAGCARPRGLPSDGGRPPPTHSSGNTSE